MEAQTLGLEEALLHRAIKSKDLDRWRVRWDGRVLLYPYQIVGSRAMPAFELDLRSISDEQLREAVRRLGIADALDFEKALDASEAEITRRKGVNQATVTQLLKHRMGLGLVSHPRAAEYLAQHYERLEGRVFEKKRFAALGKRWYEYHRPRDPKLMLSRRRLLSPTLVKTVRFSLDTAGYLSDHACLFLQPSRDTQPRYLELRRQLATALRCEEVSLEDVLKYCLAFLNSDYAQQRLTTGHRPTPKGFYAVTEEFLREIPIPPPGRVRSRQLLTVVKDLVSGKDGTHVIKLEQALAKLVNSALKP
jgi:hypothetical protein